MKKQNNCWVEETKNIYLTACEADMSFSRRNDLLERLNVVQVRPLLAQVIEKVKAEPTSEQSRQEILESLTYIQDQLTLRGELRKKASILKRTQELFTEIKSQALLTLLRELRKTNENLSKKELLVIENVIPKLSDALKEKNYIVLEKINQKVQLMFPDLCDLV